MSVCCRNVSNTDLKSLSSTMWMNVHSSMTILTSHSAKIRERTDQFLYQQSHIFHQQGSANNYATQLAQLGQTLPLLLNFLLSAQQACTFPLLHNLTLCERATIRLQLLIFQHEPDQAMNTFLDLTVPASPGVCPISCAWQATVAAIQVGLASKKADNVSAAIPAF